MFLSVTQISCYPTDENKSSPQISNKEKRNRQKEK